MEKHSCRLKKANSLNSFVAICLKSSKEDNLEQFEDTYASTCSGII